MVEIIAPIEEGHILHLERIVHGGVPGIRQGQQLGRGFNRYVKLAVSERAAEIVVVAAQVVAPVELVPGGTHAPQIVGPDGGSDNNKYGPSRPHSRILTGVSMCARLNT
jgi:hypothetical protein